MKSLSIVTLALALVACGGDSAGPSDTFTGTWVGNAYPSESDTSQFSVIAAQSGSVITGVGTYSQGGLTYGAIVNGISTPPNLNLVLTINSQTVSYVATYASSDSVAGILTVGSSHSPLSLKKQ